MFYDIAAQLAGNPAQLHYGVSVAAFDQAGLFEIFVAGFGCPSKALKWDGEALFDVPDADLAAPTLQSVGVAAADIDGDGREGVYVTIGRASRRDRVWRNGK